MAVFFFLWAIALDALLVAHDHDTFEERLCRFVGEDSFVFPTDSFGAQPKYTVGEIAEDFYVFRNIVAHGNEIPVEYRQTIGFEMTDKTIYGSAPIWTYQKRQLYSDCAIFLLCAVLRKILMCQAHMKIVGTSSWDKYLDSGGR